MRLAIFLHPNVITKWHTRKELATTAKKTGIFIADYDHLIYDKSLSFQLKNPVRHIFPFSVNSLIGI